MSAQHQQQITREYLRDLAATTGFPRVTVHQPMEVSGSEVAQNSVRLRNAATETQQALEAAEVDRELARALVAPIESLADNDPRMQHQLGGISFFIDGEETRILESAFVPPMSIEVASRYAVLPLLEPAIVNRDYAILTLSLGGVGLYRASRFAIEYVELEGLPQDLCYVLRYDDFEKSVQLHTSSRGGDAAIHHGHGQGKDEHDRFVSRFIDAVEPLVTRYVAREQLPLVLIGTDEALGRYRADSSYPGIRSTQHVVDPHTLDLDRLLQLGWEAMRAELEAEHDAELERFNGHDRTVSGIHAVLPAAAEGRVDTLLVNPESDIRGAFDPATGRVSQEQSVGTRRENLTNLALCYGLLNGASLVAVRPGDGLTRPGAILY